MTTNSIKGDHLTTEERLSLITDAMDGIKAVEPQIVDIRGKSIMADYLVVCTGTSDTHVRAVADKVNEAVQAKRLKSDNAEGLAFGHWVLLDYGDIIVHVMQAEQRAYYRVEELWEKMPLIEDMWDRKG